MNEKLIYLYLFFNPVFKFNEEINMKIYKVSFHDFGNNWFFYHKGNEFTNFSLDLCISNISIQFNHFDLNFIYL
jgi:hypothetical protein